MADDQNTPLPKLKADPRNRAELKDWLEDRARWTDEPLSAREYLMVRRLQSSRPPYSLT
jgi:hypothetical protein